MKIPVSPISGKPMKVVPEPEKMKFRGEEYDCIYVSFHDDADGESCTTTESDSVWFNQVTNQYRERHGIPYQDEIIALRERYGLSAAKMSLILGFGANQYRLYEDGEVPSESNGKMIRSAMNPRTFMDLVRSSCNQLSEREFAKIESRVSEILVGSKQWYEDKQEESRLFKYSRGIANGFAPISTSRLKNLLLYILDRMGATYQTKMNKVLFYIDFLAYREHGNAISGLAYSALNFGPVPQRWDRVYSAFDDVLKELEVIQDQECVSLSAGEKPDMSVFSEWELQVIDSVCNKVGKMSSREISKMSHEEVAWKDHIGKPESIPFNEAFKLVMM